VVAAVRTDGPQAPEGDELVLFALP